jgi:hypothetical protein
MLAIMIAWFQIWTTYLLFIYFIILLVQFKIKNYKLLKILIVFDLIDIFIQTFIYFVFGYQFFLVTSIGMIILFVEILLDSSNVNNKTRGEV